MPKSDEIRFGLDLIICYEIYPASILLSISVRQWSPQNDLQLNAGKSEVILLGTAVQLRSAADITTIDIAGSPLPVALKLKSLGVIYVLMSMSERSSRHAITTFALYIMCAMCCRTKQRR